MNSMQITQALPLQTSTSFQHNANKEGSGFVKILDHFISGNEGNEVLSPILFGRNSDDLLASIDQILKELALSDLELPEDLLATTFVEDLLKQLPVELKLDIETFLASDKDMVLSIGQGQHVLQQPQIVFVMLAKMIQVANDNYKPENQGTYLTLISKLISHMETLLPKKEMDVIKENVNKQQFLMEAFSRGVQKNDVTATSNTVPQHSGQLLNPIHQLTLHIGEGRGWQQNGEQLLRQFNNILAKSSFTQLSNGINKLSIKLFPQHLGRLDVTLTQQNGVMIAQLMTTTKAAKSAIESQLTQLKQAFVAQNIQIEKIEIQTQQQFLQSDKQQQHDKQNSQQNNRNKEKDDLSEEKSSFEDILNNETFEAEV